MYVCMMHMIIYVGIPNYPSSHCKKHVNIVKFPSISTANISFIFKDIDKISTKKKKFSKDFLFHLSLNYVITNDRQLFCIFKVDNFKVAFSNMLHSELHLPIYIKIVPS